MLPTNRPSSVIARIVTAGLAVTGRGGILVVLSSCSGG
jgi:hypothetical protein